jgi:hypothetical protein
VIASKEAWEKIHGFPEDPSFYMATDAYGIFQLFAAGYDQAIFMQPHRIFHADHDRSGRAGFVEPDPINHDRKYYEILKGQVSYACFNDTNWGLANYALKFWNHPAPDTLPKNFVIGG